MFYNFRKNKKAFTLVELIVVIAIIAILGAVVGVVVSRFVDNARESAALSPLKSVVDNYESYKVSDPDMTVKEWIAEMFKNDKTSFYASAATVWTTKITKLTGTVYLSFHDSNCGDYYGVLKIESGNFQKDKSHVYTQKSNISGAVQYAD